MSDHNWEKSHHRTLRNRLEDATKTVDVVKVKNNPCCMARTKVCMACEMGITIAKFCKEVAPLHEEDFGCDETKHATALSRTSKITTKAHIKTNNRPLVPSVSGGNICKSHVVFTTFKCPKCTTLRKQIEDNTKHSWSNLDKVTFEIVSDVKLNEHDVPILSDMYKKMFVKCPNSLTYTYINGDIISTSRFVDTIEAVQHIGDFLMVGRRTNVAWSEEYDTKDKKFYFAKHLKDGNLFQVDAQDYFVVTKNAIEWDKIPAFVVGRPGYDNWLVDHIYHNPKVALIDGTKTIDAIHQTDKEGNWAHGGKKLSSANKEYNRRLGKGKWDHGHTTHAEWETEVVNGKIVLKHRKSKKVFSRQFKIHVLTMNRAKSLKRLLDSLENSDYDNDKVELYIHIDKSSDNSGCIKVGKSFKFSHGKIILNVAKENNGLRNAWFKAWRPKAMERAIILEDDIEVSPKWYLWLKKSWETYGERNDIAGISLQRQTLVPQKPNKEKEIVNNHEPFLYRLVGSIGFSPHWQQWQSFLKWVDSVNVDTVNVKTPDLITSDWFDTLDRRQIWTQYFIWFCNEHDLYTLYLNLPYKKTFASHMREKGEHFTRTEGRDFALATQVTMNFPIDLVKYGWDGQKMTKKGSEGPKTKLVTDGSEYGEWTYDSSPLTSNSVVYSVGLGEDTSWDEGIIKRVGLNVWGFDPTPKSIKYVRSNSNLGSKFHFTPEGLSTKKGVLTFTKPKNPNYVSMREGKHSDGGATVEVPVNSLANWMQKFNHTHLDILKIDIEGSEYDVVEDLIRQKWFPMDQLLVEFHQRFFVDKTRHNRLLNALKSNGFNIIHNKGGQEISFRRRAADSYVDVIAKAKEINSAHGMLVLQFLNEGYLEMTKSWICNVKKFPGAISHVLFVATDKISYETLKAFDPSLNVYFAKVKAIKSMTYGQKVYWQYMLWRAKFLGKLLQNGVTILLTEADQIWFKNVVTDMKKRLSSKNAFICLNDQCSEDNQLVNGGFQLIRPTKTLLDLWKAYILKYEDMLNKYKSTPDTTDIGDVSDQITLSNMIKSSSIPYEFLPVGSYVCGKYFRSPEVYKAPILVHNNWIKGNNAKISRAKKNNHWFLDPTGVQCNGVIKNSPIIVTGVAGYIGSHAALQLLEEGNTVVGIDNLSRGSTTALDVLRKFDNFRFYNIDLGDSQSLDKIIKKYKHARTIFHFAAVAFTLESVEFPELYKSNITLNTKILVDTMIRYKIPQLIYSSSCSVYGSPTEFPITEETSPSPVSPYGVAKLNAEKYIQKQASAGNIRAHLLRYFNVIGADPKGRLGENPRPNLAKYARLWTATVETILKRRKCVTLYDSTLDTPDGTSIRDYVHVSDLVDAHLSVLKYGFKNPVDIWNIGTGTGVSTKEFIKAAKEVSGKDIPICLESRKKSHSPPKLYASSKKLLDATGWKPRFTDIKNSLKTAWDIELKKEVRLNTARPPKDYRCDPSHTKDGRWIRTVRTNPSFYDCDKALLDKYKMGPVPKGKMLSQEHEDEIVYRHFFWKEQTGEETFVELGALDGLLYSNSYFFEKTLGWSGLLIEGETSNYVGLEKNRNGNNKVKTLHACVCKEEKLLHLFGRGAMADTTGAQGDKRSTCPCIAMQSLLKMAGINRVDFYSIDVEGAELDVVTTHDWDAVPVRVVLIETRPADEDKSLSNAKLRKALHERGLCRFDNIVGHNNEIWFNSKFVT